MKRRKFIQTGALTAGAVIAAPTIFTAPRVRAATAKGNLLFKPHYVQAGIGPHLLDWAYHSDINWHSFH